MKWVTDQLIIKKQHKEKFRPKYIGQMQQQSIQTTQMNDAFQQPQKVLVYFTISPKFIFRKTVAVGVGWDTMASAALYAVRC